MIKNLRSLPEDKTSFGTDQLSKFDILSRKVCLTIRPLSSQTEGTFTILRLKATCWNQEWLPKVAGDGGSKPSSLGHFTRLSHRQWQHFMANRVGFNLFGLLWFSPTNACSKRTFPCRRSWLAMSCLLRRERDSGRDVVRERR